MLAAQAAASTQAAQTSVQQSTAWGGATARPTGAGLKPPSELVQDSSAMSQQPPGPAEIAEILGTSSLVEPAALPFDWLHLQYDFDERVARGLLLQPAHVTVVIASYYHAIGNLHMLQSCYLFRSFRLDIMRC